MRSMPQLVRGTAPPPPPASRPMPRCRAVLLAAQRTRLLLRRRSEQGGCSSGEPGRSGRASVASLREHLNPMVGAWYELPRPGGGGGQRHRRRRRHEPRADRRHRDRRALRHVPAAVRAEARTDARPRRHLSSAAARRHRARQGAGPARRAADGADAASVGLDLGLRRGRCAGAAAEALARRLAGRPDAGLSRIKKTFNQQPAATLSEQLARRSDGAGRLAAHRGLRRRLAAFRGKRAPQFRGG